MMARVAAIVQLEQKYYNDRKKKCYLLEELEDGGTLLEVYLQKLKRLKFIDDIIVFTSILELDAPFIEVAERVGITKIERFSDEGLKEKLPSFQRHNWGVHTDTPMEFFNGAWFDGYEKLKNYDDILYILPENILFDSEHVREAYKFHKEGEFDYTYPEGCYKGCSFSYFTSDLIRGLNKTDSLRTIRGGVPSAVIHKLYPFKIGVFRREIFRDHFYFDLMPDSRRMFEFIKKSEIYKCESYAEVKQIAHDNSEDYFNFPRVIHFEPSSFCNLTCSFCPHQKLTREKSFLDLDTYKKVIESCAGYDDIIFRFSGFGEPTSSDDLIEMIRLAGEADIYTHLVTNGSNVTAKYVGALINARVKALTFSIDGHTPELHAKLRPELPFAKLQTHIQNLVNIKELGPDLPVVIVQVVKSRETDPHLIQYTEYFANRSNDVPQQQYFPFVFRKNSIQWMMITGYSDYLGALPDLEDIDYTPFFRTPCRHECERALVLSDGRLYQCHMDFDGKRPLGDLSQVSLKEAWNTAEKIEQRRKQVTQEYKNIPLCCDCNDWYQN